MAERPLKILQVSSSDFSGGAQKVAWDLFRSYQERGYRSWLAVGLKRSGDPDVFQIRQHAPHDHWARLWLGLGDVLSPLVGEVRGAKFLRDQLQRTGQPRHLLDWWRGVEDFNFPGSWRILEMTPEHPDIVHCHNLHKEYFDLRALPWLSQQAPLFMTLHDAWLLSGHCAHSFDCERWKLGCGQCPDLTIYPAIRRDATASNWQRKRDIFAQCRLYIAAPSQWLMHKVEQSIVAPAIVEARVIPNGVDLSVFHLADKQVVRAALGIPKEAKVLLFTANGIRKNIWKDYQTMRTAVALVAERLNGQSVLFVGLGGDAPEEQIGQVKIRFVPYQKAPEAVARYYQAADLYVHAARADTFPVTVLEALACGTPVVATAVGGIPEQVKGLRVVDRDGYGPDEATGVLVPRGDAKGLAAGIERLLTDEDLCQHLARNAATDARKRFNLEHQVESYLAWYKELLADSEQRRFRPSVAPVPG